MTATATRATQVMETRTAPLSSVAVELRAAEDGPKFHGTAIVYNQRTAIGNPASWGWYEEIAPGCATKTLAESDVRFLVDHDSDAVVSRTTGVPGLAQLTLTDTPDALEVDSDLNVRKSYVADLVENLTDRSITGMSFGFYVVKDEWTRETVTVTNDQGVAAELEVEVRRILEIRLVEVSAVTFPAYDQTEAGLRSMCDEVRSTYLPAPASGEGHEPAETTRDSDDEPAAATRSDEAYHLRFRARAKRDGLPFEG